MSIMDDEFVPISPGHLREVDAEIADLRAQLDAEREIVSRWCQEAMDAARGCGEPGDSIADVVRAVVADRDALAAKLAVYETPLTEGECRACGSSRVRQALAETERDQAREERDEATATAMQNARDYAHKNDEYRRDVAFLVELIDPRRIKREARNELRRIERGLR